MEQFALYELNHPSAMHYREGMSRLTDSPSREIASDMTLNDAQEFCEWLTWRMKLQGKMPAYGYEFQIDPWTHREHIPGSAALYLPDGFRVILQQVLSTEVRPPLYQLGYDAINSIARIYRMHEAPICFIFRAVMFVGLPLCLCLWIWALYKRSLQADSINDET